MGRLHNQLHLLFASPPSAGAGSEQPRPNQRDDSSEARALAMLAFPVVTAFQWQFVEPGAHAVFIAAFLFVVLANAVGWLVDLERLPRRVEMSLPTMTLVAVWLMTATTGGVAGAFGIALLIPLIWFVLYAEPGDILVALLVTACCLALPVEQLLPQLPDQGSGLVRGAYLSVVITILLPMRPLVVLLRRNAELAQRATYSLRASHAALAHDLRTPLTGICGLTALAQQRLEDPDSETLAVVGDYVARIDDLGWHAESIIEGILELSRADDRLPGVESIDVPALLDRLGAELPGLVVRVGNVPAHVIGHRPSIERLFRNLLENALRHAPGAADRAVAVTITGATEPSGVWRFDVRDDGIGFDPTEIPILFEPWHRGAAANDGGHGLGLAIVAAIVEQHSGSIAASNCPGGGARISFTLSRSPQVAAVSGPSPFREPLSPVATL